MHRSRWMLSVQGKVQWTCRDAARWDRSNGLNTTITNTGDQFSLLGWLGIYAKKKTNNTNQIGASALFFGIKISLILLSSTIAWRTLIGMWQLWKCVLPFSSKTVTVDRNHIGHRYKIKNVAWFTRPLENFHRGRRWWMHIGMRMRVRLGRRMSLVVSTRLVHSCLWCCLSI